MTTERLNKLVNEPQYLVSSHEGGFSLPLPESGESLVFHPVLIKSVLSDLRYSFSPETNFRGLLEAVCCIYRQRPWYHMFHLDSRELLNFIQDKNDDLIEGIMDDIRDVSDVCDSLASAIGKSLLQPLEGSYTGDFFRDLALADERFSRALSTLFPNGEIRISLRPFTLRFWEFR